MAPSWHEQSDDAVTGALRDKLQQLESGDGFARLGLGHDADTTAIRAAFLEATKAFHPSRFARRPEEARRLANEVFLLIKGAYVQLSSESGRARARKGQGKARPKTEPVPNLRSREARARFGTPPAGVKVSLAQGTPPARTVSTSRDREERFAAAVAMLSQGEYDQACDELQRLAAENPNLSKFQVYVHYARGKRHADAGAVAGARAEFEQALTLHPGFFLATKAIAQLPGEGDAAGPAGVASNEDGGSAKKRGLFSKLFRK